MILVVGATGRLGGTITRQLLDRAKPVRVLVRAGSPYEALEAAGAEPAIGDLKDPASLAAACSGVDAVVTTATSAARGGADTIGSVDQDGSRNLIESAAAAGVPQFVYTSVLGADPESPVPLVRAKAEVEARLLESGMGWTILRPDAFMDTWFPALVGGPVLAGQPVTIVGEGLRRHSFVAMRDVAAYAVAALEHDFAKGKILPLGGPRSLTWHDVVEAFEQEVGHPIELRSVGPGEPVPGIPDLVAGLLAMLDTYDSPLEMDELAKTYGVTPTTAADFVRGFLGSIPNSR